MTNEEQAKMKMLGGVCTCLTDNAEVYADDAPFQTIAAKTIADTNAVELASTAAYANNKGFSADKLIAKNEASTLGEQLCARAKVKLNIIGNQTLSQALNGTFSFYYKASDAVCASRLMNVYNVMDTNQALITNEYVTTAQLATFLGKINNYTLLTGNTTNAHTGSPALTKEFKTDLKEASADIEVIKQLAKPYEETNTLFFNALKGACKIPPITVRHTPVNFTLTNSITLALLPDVEGTLSKTKELGLSNALGIMPYTDVSAGAAIATFALPGFITGIQTVRIIRGATNTFAIALVPGTMTPEMEAAITAKVTAFNTAEAAKKAAKAAKEKARRDAKAAKKK